MAEIATHIRIFEANPSDEFVNKRREAVDELAKRFRTRSGRDAIQLAEGLLEASEAKAKMPEALAVDVENAIRKHSAAFVRDGSELEMVVCALLAAQAAVEQTKGESKFRLLAPALWSGFEFQAKRTEPKLEALRTEVLAHARSVSQTLAIQNRSRHSVPDFELKGTAPSDWTGFAEGVKAASKATIEALRANAELDREEIDLLWWAMSDWSSLLDTRLSSCEPVILAIAGCVELGGKLREIPPLSFRNIALRSLKSADPTSLVQVLELLGEARGKIVGTDEAKSWPRVFPLLTAVRSGDATGKPKSKRTVQEWAERALLESALLRIVPGKAG